MLALLGPGGVTATVIGPVAVVTPLSVSVTPPIAPVIVLLLEVWRRYRLNRRRPARRAPGRPAR
jgi:hypothetical protein